LFVFSSKPHISNLLLLPPQKQASLFEAIKYKIMLLENEELNDNYMSELNIHL